MARYIDADALLDSLMGYTRYISIQYGELEMLECDVVKQCIESAPTADVVERKKGKWVKDSDTPFYWMCSECGAYLFWRKDEYLLREEDEANFCPNCGADMRERKMDDLISRQDAIDACINMCKHYTPTKSVKHPHIDFVVETLKELPSATVRHKPLIRCKDCKFWNEEERLCNDLMAFGRSWYENDYCSYGEMKEGDNND